MGSRWFGPRSRRLDGYLLTFMRPWILHIKYFFSTCFSRRAFYPQQQKSDLKSSDSSSFYFYSRSSHNFWPPRRDIRAPFRADALSPIFDQASDKLNNVERKTYTTTCATTVPLWLLIHLGIEKFLLEDFSFWSWTFSIDFGSESESKRSCLIWIL